MTVFADILHAAYDIEYEAQNAGKLVLASYLRKWRIAIARAKRVNRLDLYHLLNALADGGFSFHATTPAEKVVASTFYAMDKAAAFGETSAPLCLPADRELDRFDYSVLEGETRELAELKCERQHPSTPDWRDFVAA